MPYSMTGFARSEIQYDWGTVSCELKSVNHRYLDIYFRMPESLREFEHLLRNQIKHCVSRGKFECALQIQTHSDTTNDQGFDTIKANAIIQAAEAIAAKIQSPAPINPLHILGMPGVATDQTIEPEALKTAVEAVLEQALEQHAAMRLREGTEMASVIDQRIDSIAEQMRVIKQVIPEIREALKQRLLDKLEQLKIDADPDRLEQELVLQAQRMDVDEEIDRLEAHMAEVRRNLSQDKPVGRRLDFLMQELNREANTLGSKSQAIESTNIAVELKVLIEQMREQIQNIE